MDHLLRGVFAVNKTYGLIDIHIGKGPNGYWYATQIAHEAERPGDSSPADWGGCSAENRELDDALKDAERLAETILANKYAKQVTIFVEGNEHKSW